MGLFDIFKKKPVQNSLNSVFTLRFAVPYFPVFDKTNPKLRAFPVKVACGGSVQYRIAEPDLCFDNVPLGQMSPVQLEEHVRDALISSIKHLINTIDYLPLLQFENELTNINDTAKRMLVPQFAEEYGISLRSLTLIRISYDEEDPNYKRLCAQSAALSDKLADQDLEELDMAHEDKKRQRARKTAVSDKLAAQELENLDLAHEDEKRLRNQRRRVKQLSDDEEVIERETNLRLRRQAVDHQMKQNEHRHTISLENERLELDHKRKELEENLRSRKAETDLKTEKIRNKRRSEELGLDIFGEDTSNIDDDFNI